jgi:L-alanine-DL-glutamate epimerase-like enolase superfamily enzyme
MSDKRKTISSGITEPMSRDEAYKRLKENGYEDIKLEIWKPKVKK